MIRAAARRSSGVRIFFPVKNSASDRFGVTSAASGNRSRRSVPRRVALQEAPPAGGHHHRIHHQRNARRLPEKTRHFADNAPRNTAGPVLTAAGGDQEKTASICARTIFGGARLQARNGPRVLRRDAGDRAGAMHPQRREGLQIGLNARPASAVRAGDGQSDWSWSRLSGDICWKCSCAAIIQLFSAPLPAYSSAMNKDQVAQVLTEIATLLELKGENPFKSRAYANAARAIETLGQPLERFSPRNRRRASRASATASTRRSASCWPPASSPIMRN